MLPGPQLDERYSITPMTRWRWRKTRVLPPPDTIINGREYWYEETLDKARALLQALAMAEAGL